jgi:hypothetical protein
MAQQTLVGSDSVSAAMNLGGSRSREELIRSISIMGGSISDIIYSETVLEFVRWSGTFPVSDTFRNLRLSIRAEFPVFWYLSVTHILREFSKAECPIN